MAIGNQVITTAQATHGTTLSFTLSATGQAGRMVLFIGVETATSTPTSVSSITGLTGITFHKRTSISESSSGKGQASEEWYADILGTTSGTVTITFAGTIDDSTVIAWLVYSTTGKPVVYDSNGSLPLTMVNPTHTGTFSTTGTAPFILLNIQTATNSTPNGSNPALNGPGPGESIDNAGGTNFQQGYLNWGSTSQQSGAIGGYTTPCNAPYTTILDALVEGTVSQGNMLAVMGL